MGASFLILVSRHPFGIWMRLVNTVFYNHVIPSGFSDI